jgi:hypothetical protein
MPMLKFKAIETKAVFNISKDLIDELQELLQCQREALSIEVLQSVYVNDGELVSGPPVVEVSWFSRTQELQDKAAKIIIKYVQKIGYSHVEVIFSILEKDKMYKV